MPYFISFQAPEFLRGQGPEFHPEEHPVFSKLGQFLTKLAVQIFYGLNLFRGEMQVFSPIIQPSGGRESPNRNRTENYPEYPESKKKRYSNPQFAIRNLKPF